MRHDGLSLIELLVYIAIASVIGSVVWHSVQWTQERQTHIDTLQQMTDNASYGLNDLNLRIARALFPPSIVAAPAGVSPFQNTHCLEVANRSVDGSTAITTYWFGLDVPTQRYSLYKASTGCNVIPLGAGLSRLTNALFIKKDNSQPFFIKVNDLIQFNFKAHLPKAGTNYEIKYHQANATQHFMKLGGSLGCKISTATAWFDGVASATSLDVQITENLDAALDRLWYTFNGVSTLCANTTLYNNPLPVGMLSCDFATATGTLSFTSTVPISSADWAKKVADIEYAPATPTSSASLKGARRSLNFRLGGIDRGSMVLDLYQLSRSCTHENFTP